VVTVDLVVLVVTALHQVVRVVTVDSNMQAALVVMDQVAR